MEAAKSNKGGVASATVREAVAVVKQIGWWVSASNTQNVWATFVGRPAFWRHASACAAGCNCGRDADRRPTTGRGNAPKHGGSGRAPPADAARRARCAAPAVRAPRCRWRGRANRWPVQSPHPGSGSDPNGSRWYRSRPRGPSASRGSTRSAGWPVHPHSKSHVPSRKCSGTNSHSPSRLPWTLSANNCRTPRSRLAGSHGRLRVRRQVGWVSISKSAPGEVGIHRVFFCRPYSSRTRSTLRVLIGWPACRSFCPITCGEASGSRKRCRITWRTTSSVRR